MYCQICRKNRCCKNSETRGDNCPDFDTFLDDETFEKYIANESLSKYRQKLIYSPQEVTGNEQYNQRP